MMTKNRKILAGVLSICLIASIAIGATLAFLTDSEKVTNVFSVGDLDITIDEPSWDNGDPEDPTKPGDGEDLMPGDTKIKDPTVSALVNDSYMRMVVSIIDDNETMLNPDYGPLVPGSKEMIPNTNKGKTVKDPDRIAKILQTVYYDNTYDIEKAPVTENLVSGQKYKLSDLANYPTVNPLFIMDESASKIADPAIIYYNYLPDSVQDGNGIFKQGEDAVLFTNIIIPTDWGRTDLNLLGKYHIEVYAQAIQTDGFDTYVDAFNALDDEVTNKTIDTDYGKVGAKK
ncbi:MAG: hypothetical protein GX896_06745 [Clostridiales bacterium]|nr:hypothetical protein [Clostridiales bacterium]